MNSSNQADNCRQDSSANRLPRPSILGLVIISLLFIGYLLVSG